MTKQEIKEQLKDSLEVSTIKSRSLLILVVTVIFCTVASLPSWGREETGLVFTLVLSMTVVPFYLIYAVILWKIFRKAAFYRFYRVKLLQPHASYFRLFHFTILLEDEEGTIITRTRSFFDIGKSSFGPSMEDYLNKTVTVAYNQETGQVVVIG